MAQNLGTSTYTLASFKANVKNLSNALSTQETGIIDNQINDIIHNSVLFMRSLLGRSLDGFYNTTATLGTLSMTAGYGSVTIASYSIADINRMSLYDPTLKEIPIVSNTQFNSFRTIYTGGSGGTIGATGAVATIFNSAGTPNVLKLGLFTGSASSSITTVELTYPRNPVKVTTDADSLDLPDHLVPITQDVAVVSIFRKLSKNPPADVESRVTSFVASQLNQLGLKVTPQG